MKKLIWPVQITGETWTAKGRRRIDTTIEGAGDAAGAIRSYVARRPRAWEWQGVAIRGLTPLGQRVTVVIGEQP